MGPDNCQITECNGLSDDTCTDVSSHRLFCVATAILGAVQLSEEYSIWLSPSRLLGSSSVSSAVFIAQEVVEAEDKESSDITKVEVQTVFEALLNMLLISTSFTEKAFIW
jgi:ABC-type Fe3+-siderophore transport system permease subunit